MEKEESKWIKKEGLITRHKIFFLVVIIIFSAIIIYQYNHNITLTNHNAELSKKVDSCLVFSKNTTITKPIINRTVVKPIINRTIINRTAINNTRR